MKKETATVVSPFRIAIRKEGDFANAYYAAPNTMKGAMLLGSMRASALRNTPGAFEKWQEILRDIISQASREALGVEPVGFRTETAPEHERGGNS